MYIILHIQQFVNFLHIYGRKSERVNNDMGNYDAVLQKEKYVDHYREIFKDKTLRKSDVTVIIERCAVQVEKEEGRQSMKTVIDNNIIDKCKYATIF